MSNAWKIVLAVLAGFITIIGLVTGKFLFLVVWLPISWLFKSKERKK